jgi:formylglycine-generating enzyme required for sulfatase activity
MSSSRKSQNLLLWITITFLLLTGCPSSSSKGSLKVLIEPPEVRQAGAQWRVDGGAWRNSEYTHTGMSEGSHTVEFKIVPEWVEPPAHIIQVVSGNTTQLLQAYSMTVSLAVKTFVDESVPAEEAADDLFDAFNVQMAKKGYDAAATELDSEVLKYIEGGGSPSVLAARSVEIPSQVFDESTVAKRRKIRAFARSINADSMEAAMTQLKRVGIEIEEPSAKALDYVNYVMFVNGINTDYSEFVKNRGALQDKVAALDSGYRILCGGCWNEDSVFDLSECTVQKILEFVEQFSDVTIENWTTTMLREAIKDQIDAGKNVIVVPHSQGNFHTREAIDNISKSKRANISALETASPVAFMPDGLRFNSRVDIEGDLVAGISGENNDPFPYEGSWGWGDWLNVLLNLSTGGFLDAPTITLLNHHSFEGAYLQGEAGDAIVDRIRSYCVGGPGQTETIMLPGDVSLEMVWIPAGTFMMGRYTGEYQSYDREDPQHQVTITSGFWVGKYEVTKAQWTAVMNTSPWSGQSYVVNDPDSPVVYISWNDARAFIAALNNYTELNFRLPSEAEWEYACRAGTTTRFYWGDDLSYTEISNYAWWSSGYAPDVNEQYAHVVGQKLPNAWGLYDISGNVAEYCEDDWHENYDGAPTNGSAWAESPRSSDRVFRGGAYPLFGHYCRSAGRWGILPTYAHAYYGFRLAR